MRRPLRRLLTALALLSIAALAGLYPYRAALLPKADDLSHAKARLAPHLRLFTPEGQGPFATVLVFHGCSGQRQALLDSVNAWLLPAGYATLFVDSYAARGIDDWRPVCAGKRLWGNQRALDVYAAIELAAQLPRVDGGRLALLGFSHGGWSILDALAYAGEAGHGFAAPGRQGLERVKAAILYYPYCGFPAELRRRMSPQPPQLMLLAGEDHITDHRQCLDALQHLPAGAIQVKRYAQADHVFDHLSDLATYQPQLAKDAQQLARGFLRSHLGPAQ
ncbi:dienelactone hydrolase family protein [Pseudomonas benzenivorans]|uniref:dienelactone hydrolase family protein n=1 Tax=Pseudomonas benzenivorans TaxID=556533 RepID=UPI0035136316